MRILVVNDDGINAPGLKILVEVAKKYGEVTVVAPFEEQSAKSHSINLKKGIKIRKSDIFDVESYYITSTPADCVRSAIFALKKDFDVVFSGVNRGYNLGEDITYSGTVSAVVEGAFNNKKGIAFSVCASNFEGAKYLDDTIKYIFDNKLLEKADILNVNLPENSKGILFTVQGKTNFDTYFDLKECGYTQEGMPRFELSKDKLTTDVGAIYNGYISITPLSIDRTDYNAYKKITNL